MKPLLIIKLGGSILTHKRTGGGMRKKFIRDVVKEVASVYKSLSSQYSLVVLHGAGSLGHPLVHRYQLSGAPLSFKTMFGFSQVTYSVETITDFLVRSLRDFHLPAMGFQTRLSFGKDAEGKVFSRCSSFFSSVSRFGGIPVLGGDLVLQENGHLFVLSADRLAVFFAREFPFSKILFATDVAGVYPTFPFKKNLRPFSRLSRSRLEDFLLSKTREAASPRDVTGGMVGKLSEILSLSRCRVVIFDGRNPKNISLVLRGGILGTSILL